MPPLPSEEVQVEERPFSSEPKESDSVKVVPPKSKNGVKVMALRNGFIKNCRKVEGDEFFVESIEKAGSWVKCVDPELEKQHLAFLKERNKAGN